jgi:LEA14-like dessication related protein
VRLLPLILLLIFSLSACLPFRGSPSAGAAIDRAEPIAPIEPLILSTVPGETVIERFDPPGPNTASLLELSLNTEAQNINPFAVTLTRISYELFLQNKAVTTGELTPNLLVEANDQAPLHLLLTTELGRTDLIKAAAQAYTGTALPFRLEGTLSFTSNNYGFTTRKLVLLSGELTSRQQLELPLLSFIEDESSVFMLREGVPVIRVLVRVANSGDVGYFLYGKDLELSLEGLATAKQDLPPIPVAAGQESRFEILFYPDVANLSSEANTMLNEALQGEETGLELRGQLLVDVLGVDTFEVPSWTIAGKLGE